MQPSDGQNLNLEVRNKSETRNSKSSKPGSFKTAGNSKGRILMATFTAGYAIVWISLVVYVGWITHRQRRLSRQYEALRRHLETIEPRDGTASKAA